MSRVVCSGGKETYNVSGKSKDWKKIIGRGIGIGKLIIKKEEERNRKRKRKLKREFCT